MKDYKTSKDSGIYDNAGNSLQWLARTNLAMGNRDAALAQIREAFQLLKLSPDANYLRNAYYTAKQIFKEKKVYDSAFYYNSLWSSLNDSLESIVSTSSISISKAKMTAQASRYNIENLNREKREEILRRNILIAAIILLSVFFILMMNRKRLRDKLRMEKVKQEKLMMEKEITSAREQMKMFTENIIEKTNLIEKLKQQAKDKEYHAGQNQLIEELLHQTILTEDDWLNFKSLFEKIYPGFFIKLKEKSLNITLAEQRMAALIRLHLTTRQMASMLGISVDSVHKTRQRLRHRLHLNNEIGLEETIATI
jgi:hypothetical protein